MATATAPSQTKLESTGRFPTEDEAEEHAVTLEETGSTIDFI
jgi:hypothetical protein